MMNNLSTFPPVCLWLLAAAPTALQAAPPIHELRMGLQGAPQAIATGPDQTVWFTLKGEGTLACRFQDGTIQTFGTAETAADTRRPRSLAAGADRAMWYLLANGAGFGRITNEGVITTFKEGRAQDSHPVSLVAANDGSLCFLDHNWRVGWLQPDPQGGAPRIREHALPRRNGRPIAIATTLDGEVYYGVSDKPVIGRIDRHGTRQEFDLVNPASRATSMVQGPDRALWFVDAPNHRIGRLDPAGTVTFHGLPSRGHARAVPGDLGELFRVGEALWFTEPRAGRIGRIDLALRKPQIHEWAFPTAGGGPADLTLGPGERVFFTRPQAEQLGYIVTAAAGNQAEKLAALERVEAEARAAEARQVQANRVNASFLFQTLTQGVPDVVGSAREVLINEGRGDQGPATYLTMTQDGNLAWLPDGGNGLFMLTPSAALAQPRPAPLGGHHCDTRAMAANPANNHLWLASEGHAERFLAVPEGAYQNGPAKLEMESHPVPFPGFDRIRHMAAGADGTLWVAHDQSLSAFQAGKNQPQQWNGHQINHLAIAGNVAWAACPEKDRILVATLGQKHIRSVALPKGSHPSRLAHGPGGVWFTMPLANAIGLVDEAGAVRTFPLPSAGSMPLDIVLAPDGNLWFTEMLGNRIGRITPQGDITEFPLPGNAGRPCFLVSAPAHGKLFYSHWNSPRIGSITVIAPAAPGDAAPQEEKEFKQEIREEPAPEQKAAAQKGPNQQAARPPRRRRIGDLDFGALGHIYREHHPNFAMAISRFKAPYDNPDRLQKLLQTAADGNQYPLVGDPFHGSLLVFHECGEVIGEYWDGWSKSWIPCRRLVIGLDENNPKILKTAFPVGRFP